MQQKMIGLIQSKKINQVAHWILIGGLIFFTCWLLRYALIAITTSGQIEYREGANLLMTEYILEGKNPFFVHHQPLMNNNYGALYSLFVLPFAAIFGNTLIVHRIVTFIFILLDCSILFYIFRRNGVALAYSIAGGIIFLACLLFLIGIVTRPDSFGVFLFLVSVNIPWVRNFDRESLIVSIIFGILAFFAKPYFVISIAIVFLYTFLFISKKKGLQYIFIFVTIFFLICALVRRFFPTYFLNTIFENIANNSKDIGYMFYQFSVFALIFCPILVILITTTRININEPFIKLPLDYFAFYFICCFAVLMVLGQHRGNYLVYYFQFLPPPLLVLAMRGLNKDFAYNIFSVPLVIINLIILCFFVLYPNDTTPAGQWDDLREILAKSKYVLNSPVLVSEMIQLGLEPLDSGSTEYFYNIEPYAGKLIGPNFVAIRLRGDDYKYEITNNIKQKGFDRIIITKDYSPFANTEYISKFYDFVREYNIKMPQNNQTWVLQEFVPNMNSVVEYCQVKY